MIKKIKLVDIAEQIIFWFFIVAAWKAFKTDPASAFIILGIDLIWIRLPNDKGVI